MIADDVGAESGSVSRPSTISPSSIELLAPTLLEYLMSRLLRPNYALRRAGMRLSRWTPAGGVDAAIVSGVAGSVVSGLRPGDVVVPDLVALVNGVERDCDAELVQRLRESARRLGFQPQGGRLLTSPEIVNGPDRDRWALAGFVAADMELGLLPEHLRIATVRVILDAPGRPISSAWSRPTQALSSRDAWFELAWLARSGPRYAWRAARIADGALRRS